MSDFRQIRYPGGRLSQEERNGVYGASQIFLSRGEGVPGLRYLVEDRGLDIETIANFRLGYMPFSADHAFNGRIVIPIFDVYDKLIALSVRPATNDEKVLDEYLKYWNESYDKGAHLFGMNKAKFSVVRERFAICVEGQFDVMSSHSYGLTNTVGVLGGAFTSWHAMLLKKWTHNVVFLFDGDAAGRKHAERAMKEIEAYSYPSMADHRRQSSHTLRAVAVFLPEGKDPADYLTKYGASMLRKLIADEMNKVGMPVPSDWIPPLKQPRKWK